MTIATEARHPIGVVAERTGLTPDVLRVWERRYRVVEPNRSPGGQRIYSDADIERLSLLYRATRGGHGISHVAPLGNAKLEELVREIESSSARLPERFVQTSQPQDSIERAMAFTRALDPNGLESVLRRSVAHAGIITFIDAFAAPFLRAVGDSWHAGQLTVAQEHLATAVVQRVVSDNAPRLAGADGSPAIVVGTLEGERHATGALMAAATAASDGWRVIYLGADLPSEQIVSAAMRTGARAVGISVVLPLKKSGAATALRALEMGLPSGTKLLVGGAGARGLKAMMAQTGVVFVDSMAEFRVELAGISGTA